MTQIAGLSSALNITYDKFVPSSEFSQNNLFESVRDSMDYGDFKNCECSVERVLLKKQQLYDCTSAINTLYVNTDDNLNIHKDIENLVREDIKYPSEMDFSCNEEFLDFHENSECYKGDNELISSRGLEKIFPEGKVHICLYLKYIVFHQILSIFHRLPCFCDFLVTIFKD